MKDIGKNLSKSIDIIDRFCIEVNSLELIIQEKLFHMINEINLEEKIRITTNWITSSRHSESTWIFTDISGSIGLSPPRKKKTKRYLSYQISLAGDAIENIHKRTEEPLVHINLWDSPINFSEGMYACVNWARTDEDVSLKHGSIFQWKSDKDCWHENQWSYSVKLTHLNDEICIENFITTPCQQLLSGEPITNTILPYNEAIFHPTR